MDVRSLNVQIFSLVMNLGKSRLSWLFVHHRGMIHLYLIPFVVKRTLQPLDGQKGNGYVERSDNHWMVNRRSTQCHSPIQWDRSDGTVNDDRQQPACADERFNTVTAGDGSATLLYAYHTLGVFRHHLWCLSTPPQCGIPTFTGGTCSLNVKIKSQSQSQKVPAYRLIQNFRSRFRLRQPYSILKSLVSTEPVT